MEEMKWKDTESTTERVVERMETSMCSMEQMSFDAINITDSLVTLTSKAREYAATMKNGDVSEREESFEQITNWKRKYYIREIPQTASVRSLNFYMR